MSKTLVNPSYRFYKCFYFYDIDIEKSLSVQPRKWQ